MRRPGLMFVVLVAATGFLRADEFDTLRLRWQDLVTGGTNLDVTDLNISNALKSLASSAQSSWNGLNKATDRAYLWSDLASMTNNPSQITSSYGRLKTMARACATHGCSLEGNVTLRADLISALDWLNVNFYNGTNNYGNWWEWQIGIPLALNDTTVLLYDALSGTQITNYMNAVEHYSPTPNMTAANLVWKATVVAVRGVVVKDGAKIASARDALGSIFPYVTAGDGFYTDGSFVQHNVHAYTGGYGRSLIANLGPLLHLLGGSTWQVTDPQQRNVVRWVYDSFQPVIYQGAMMAMVCGREIARSSTDHASGADAIASLIRIAQFAPPADAAAIKGMVKYWVQADTSRNFVANASLPVIPLAKAILNDTNIVSRGELLGHFTFGSMDRVVHLRPGYGLGLSLSSGRIANYESINSENLHGWYTGDGMTYLYNSDLTHYGGNFWPTVNPYRLPGTTVDTQARADGSGQGYRGTNKWVGGATLGNHGAAGMQLSAWGSPLVANKSWFMFDNEIVCLGAGINNPTNRGVETIVENRRLTSAGANAFTVDGTAKSTALGWSEAMTHVTWAALAGNVAGADLGYYFPEPVTLNGLRERRTGRWYDIDHSYSTNFYTNNYLTLWFDHGTNPVNATYAYVLLPNLNAAQVAAYAANPNVVMLENSPRAQGVRETNLNLTAINFWSDGTNSLGGITVDKKACVLVQNSGTNLEVAVSDPTQANTNNINLEIATPAVYTLSLDPGVTVIQLNPTLKLSIDVKNAGGRTFRATLSLVPPPNQRPVAVGDNALADPGTPKVIDVLANDDDPDKGPEALAVQSVGPAAHGATAIADGEVRYSPADGFAGPDSFAYVITDGALTATGMVNVAVGAVPLGVVSVTASDWQTTNAPLNTVDGDLDTRWSASGDGQWIVYDLGGPEKVAAVAIAFFGGTNRQAFFEIQASSDGTNWVVVSTSASSGATLALEPFGFPGQWANQMRIVGHTNSQNAWNSYTEVQILGFSNTPPVAVADVAVTDESLPVLVDVLANDTDPDAGPSTLSLMSVGPAENGAVEIVAGQAQYVATVGFAGADTFPYVIFDGGLTTTGRVNVSVQPVTNYAGFQNVYFTAAQRGDPAVSGPLADPDHDRISNLLEYALMLDPWRSGVLPQPVIENGHFTFTYVRRKLATDLNYRMDVGTDVSDWDISGAQIDQAVVAETATSQVVKVTDKSAAGPRSRRFFKLVVELADAT